MDIVEQLKRLQAGKLGPYPDREIWSQAIVEIERLRAEVQSKNEQIGTLYKVCNERDIIKNASGRLHAALLLAQTFMPTVRREMPHQANLIDAHKVVADALDALRALEQGAPTNHKIDWSTEPNPNGYPSGDYKPPTGCDTVGRPIDPDKQSPP